jgi:hypothetical protein
MRNHKQMSENYKFAYGEIERVMNIKRTTSQFSENLDVISNMMNSYEMKAAPVFKRVQRKYPLHIPPNPELPISPGASRESSPNPLRSFNWSTDYPLLSEHTVLKEFYKDVNNVGHYLNDVEGHVERVDEMCCHLVGMSEEDIISPSGFGWVQKIHRDEAELVLEEWNKSVNRKQVFFQKYRFIHSHETVVYVVAEAYPRFSRKGVYQGYEGVILNIPEHVWEELKL